MPARSQFRSERRRRLELAGDPFSPEARARIRARQHTNSKKAWANPEKRARMIGWRESLRAQGWS